MAEKKNVTPKQEKALTHDCFKCENFFQYEYKNSFGEKQKSTGICTIAGLTPVGTVLKCSHFDHE